MKRLRRPISRRNCRRQRPKSDYAKDSKALPRLPNLEKNGGAIVEGTTLSGGARTLFIWASRKPHHFLSRLVGYPEDRVVGYPEGRDDLCGTILSENDRAEEATEGNKEGEDPAQEGRDAKSYENHGTDGIDTQN